MGPDTNSNPYASSASADTADSDKPFNSDAASVDFAPIIRRWERLRIGYNAILVAFVLLVTLVGAPGHTSVPEYWMAIAVGGVIANLCFLTGPAIEGYGTRFRVWNGIMTIVLFVAGLGFTMFLAIMFIATLTGAF